MLMRDRRRPRAPQLSIPRDTVVDIPGHGRDKINAAYASAAPALTIQTVEQYLGIPINHLVEVNFANFPKLIDAIGGIDYTGGCVVSQHQRRLQERRLHAAPAPRHEPPQRQAGARARAHAQERVQPARERPHRARAASRRSSARSSRASSARPFMRLPWVSWHAPKTLRTDMGGPTLLGYASAPP